MTSHNCGDNIIHLYRGDEALLTESLEVIQKTSAVIFSALENPVEVIGLRVQYASRYTSGLLGITEQIVCLVTELTCITRR